MAADLVHLKLPADRHRAAVAVRKAAIAEDIAAALSSDRVRCADLVIIAIQAARLGVRFDAADAIRSGISVNDAREHVMSEAANKKDYAR
ncbi:hypothetical protein [Rhizobium leguminosarum]|uniref:Uncharacterized protein n=1 Tax=Rhizobium leguminosarum bv. viciae TaxID=387 RepID=A0A8G2MW01_RHILV|nr:hypothetical protein [Rhizobium leguminosarum]MBY5619964.1 hypothetical protein [Rhizobium leguminosarum]NKK18616.1 hypothetical protein [Rhizobium leguminosarum bv. viciae]TBX98097.1 hypothetical protein E0H31_04100 [Rhizobium leguminosarum bv. viciae]TBZ09437.1 hypothetical protein E0H33_25445 [Rhizobium leguminosarum bv. viciae]TBZ10933.1 hypothetical protein E0H52_32545 [Rhizobium leguminosarum bv. viciae]